jgi:truncated hemoglobin YjbI
MSSKNDLNQMKAFSEELRKDPRKLRAFLRSVMGRPSITLEGKEREQVLMMLHMMEPFKETNNQHSWTSYYMIGDTEYHVTTFPNDIESIVDKMLPEEE